MSKHSFVTGSADPYHELMRLARQQAHGDWHKKLRWRPRDAHGRFVKSPEAYEEEDRRKMAAAIREAIMTNDGITRVSYKPEPEMATERAAGLLHVVRLALVKEIENAQTIVYMRKCGFALLAVQRMAEKHTNQQSQEETNTHG